MTFPTFLRFNKHTVEQAIEVERTEASGRALGLSAEEISEVVRSWQAVFIQTPWPLPWDKVRHALIMRAMGEEWKP